MPANGSWDLIRRLKIKKYWGRGGDGGILVAPLILTAAQCRGLLVSRPGVCILGESVRIHWIGGRIGSRGALGNLKKRHVSCA